jgi:energy-coupling factor transporter transmembrane protein EcfT
MSADAVSAAPAKRREAEITLLRYVPRSSPMHRLWAGTKIIVVAVLSLVASLRPTWPTLVTLAVLVCAGFVVGRIPWSALPRLPRWFLVALLISAALSSRSSAAPMIQVAGQSFSLGGLADWARLTTLTALLVLSAGLLGWTTQLGEIAPALSRLSRPLRRTRLPIDEWITAVALSLRTLPLLVTETRTLLAARRLRRRSDADRRRSLRRAGGRAHRLLVTALRVAMRHAEDVGDALESRGGAGSFDDPETRPHGSDYGVLIAVAVIAAVLLAA